MIVRSLFLLMVGTAVLSASGQQLSNYEGAYRLSDSVSGTAVYDFFTSGGDTIKNGSFEFSHTRPDTAETSTLKGLVYKGITYKGTYSENLKNDAWEYKLKKFAADTAPEIIGNRISYPANGNQYVINARFANGSATGNWEASRHRVIRGNIQDTTFYAQTKFNNGVIFGGFYGYVSGLISRGEFTENGLLDGTWEVEHEIETGKKVFEYRNYEKGVLKSHYFEIDDKDRYEINHIGLDTTPSVNGNETWDTINISDQYFTVLKTSIFEDDKKNNTENRKLISSLSEKSNNYLERALYCFGYHNKQTVWSQLPGNDSIHYAKVRLRKFPYEEKEEEKLSAIKTDLKNSKQIISDFFKDSQVEVSRHSHEGIMVNYEILKVYREDLNQLITLQKHLSNPALLYLNRTEIFPYLMPEFDHPESVKYSYDDEEREKDHQFPEPLDKDNEYLDELKRVVTDYNKNIERLYNEVEKKVEKYKKQAELREKEDQLVNKRDTVQLLFNPDSTKSFNKYHSNIRSRVLDFVDEKMKRYAKRSTEERLADSDSLIECFNNLILLHKTYSDLPEQIERIDELYIRNVWNPFTLTYMDERIKERIYNKYDNVIIPELLKTTRNNITCGKIKHHISNFDNVYSKMVKVRREDTKKIEKQLRRENDIHEINRIMDLNLNLK